MLFAWIGFMDPAAGPVPQDVNRETTAFLEQPYITIHSVGPLCDEQGRRAGMLMIFEAADRAAAEALTANSPYHRAGLYKQALLHEYRNEAG